MQEGLVGALQLLPADEQASRAIEPTVQPLDHPAARPFGRIRRTRVRTVLAPRADMGAVAALLGSEAWQVVVIAFVQAQMLGLLGARLRADEDRKSVV